MVHLPFSLSSLFLLSQDISPSIPLSFSIPPFSLRCHQAKETNWRKTSESPRNYKTRERSPAPSTSQSPRVPTASTLARTNSRTASGIRGRQRTPRSSCTARLGCVVGRPLHSQRMPGGGMWGNILGAGWTGRPRGGRLRGNGPWIRK